MDKNEKDYFERGLALGVVIGGIAVFVFVQLAKMGT